MSKLASQVDLSQHMHISQNNQTMSQHGQTARTADWPDGDAQNESSVYQPLNISASVGSASVVAAIVDVELDVEACAAMIELILRISSVQAA